MLITWRQERNPSYRIRRMATDQHIPLLTNVQFAKALVRSIEKYQIEDLGIKEWEEYKN